MEVSSILQFLFVYLIIDANLQNDVDYFRLLHLIVLFVLNVHDLLLKISERLWDFVNRSVNGENLTIRVYNYERVCVHCPGDIRKLTRLDFDV
jgi:hypothetical protein